MQGKRFLDDQKTRKIENSRKNTRQVETKRKYMNEHNFLSNHKRNRTYITH